MSFTPTQNFTTHTSLPLLVTAPLFRQASTTFAHYYSLHAVYFRGRCKSFIIHARFHWRIIKSITFYIACYLIYFTYPINTAWFFITIFDDCQLRHAILWCLLPIPATIWLYRITYILIMGAFHLVWCVSSANDTYWFIINISCSIFIIAGRHNYYHYIWQQILRPRAFAS